MYLAHEPVHGVHVNVLIPVGFFQKIVDLRYHAHIFGEEFLVLIQSFGVAAKPGKDDQGQQQGGYDGGCGGKGGFDGRVRDWSVLESEYQDRNADTQRVDEEDAVSYFGNVVGMAFFGYECVHPFLEDFVGEMGHGIIGVLRLGPPTRHSPGRPGCGGASRGRRWW